MLLVRLQMLNPKFPQIFGVEVSIGLRIKYSFIATVRL